MVMRQNQYFTNPDLNVASIALHFNLTPTYVSSVFKGKNGFSLLDYINKMRLERA
jgi:two-component system response regulator YesN